MTEVRAKNRRIELVSSAEAQAIAVEKEDLAGRAGEGQIAPLVLGLIAIVAGLVGTFWIGMAGLVWRPWEFGTTHHWEASESSLGVTVGLSFLAVAAGLLLGLLARGIWAWRRRSAAARTLVMVVPVVAIAIVFTAWTLLLSPGGSQPTWGL